MVSLKKRIICENVKTKSDLNKKNITKMWECEKSSNEKNHNENEIKYYHSRSWMNNLFNGQI